MSTHGAQLRLKPVDRNWIGAVPEHWDTALLKLVARLESGHTPSRLAPEYWENCTIPWFTLADVWQLREERRKYVLETAEMVSELGIANSSARLLPAGTVMLSRTASVGFTGIMGREMATTQDFVNWVCGSKLRPEYLWYCLQAMTPEYDRLRFGSTHHTIYMPDVAQFKVPVPPIPEQDRIANFLDTQTARIDLLIAEKEQLLERLYEYAAAYANEVFRNRLAVRGGVRLKYRCPEVTVGIVVTPAKYYVKAGTPCLRSLNVGEGYLIPENLVHIAPEANELHSKSKIFAGDIVVVRSGKTGAAAVVTPEFDGANCIDLVIIRSSPQVDSNWLRVYLNSPPALEQVTDASEGAIQQHFNVGSARELRIPDSSLDEQRADVAEVLRVQRASSELAVHVKSNIERLREYRSSLISAAVTGQLDIRAYEHRPERLAA